MIERDKLLCYEEGKFWNFATHVVVVCWREKREMEGQVLQIFLK